MTIVLGLIGKNYAVQVSDRRLTEAGKIVDEEQGKSLVFHTIDARLAVSYAGLARYKNFKTSDWLGNILYESARPDFLADKTILRAAEFANRHPIIKQLYLEVGAKNSLIEILFTGFIKLENGGGHAVAAKLTNADDNGKRNFQAFFQEQADPLKLTTNAIGWIPALSSRHKEIIVRLLSTSIRKEKLMGNLYDVICDMSRSPASSNTIGSQLNFVIVPRNHTKNVESQYITTSKIAAVLCPMS